MNSNITKTLNPKKPFYNQDIMHLKTKAETKIIYQKIIQQGSKQHTGETLWKKKPNVDFKGIWKKHILLLWSTIP